MAESQRKKHVISLSRDELKTWATENSHEAFRANQVFDWMYGRGVTDFHKMHNIPLKLKEDLLNAFDNQPLFLCDEQISSDGTRKWLVSFDNVTEQAEIVYIPDRTRGTLCISSQIGCTLSCTFCHTGTQALVRNLRSDEIVRQVMFAKSRLNDWLGEKSFITNVVFMGMGEPFLNYDSVIKSIEGITKLNISKKRITVSTSGIVPRIYDCAVDSGVNLAISLHAVDDELRNEIVPINRKYPIEELLLSCKKYSEATNNERITFEYVMLKGVNDTNSHAKKLVSLIKGIPAKINIIPFNPWPGSIYECSSKQRIDEFASIIERAGYIAPIRRPRGEDIMAACGQLRSESIKTRKSCANK